LMFAASANARDPSRITQFECPKKQFAGFTALGLVRRPDMQRRIRRK
jgi:hypothetical protein